MYSSPDNTFADHASEEHIIHGAPSGMSIQDVTAARMHSGLRNAFLCLRLAWRAKWVSQVPTVKINRSRDFTPVGHQRFPFLLFLLISSRRHAGGLSSSKTRYSELVYPSDA